MQKTKWHVKSILFVMLVHLKCCLFAYYVIKIMIRLMSSPFKMIIEKHLKYIIILTVYINKHQRGE